MSLRGWKCQYRSLSAWVSRLGLPAAYEVPPLNRDLFRGKPWLARLRDLLRAILDSYSNSRTKFYGELRYHLRRRTLRLSPIDKWWNCLLTQSKSAPSNRKSASPWCCEWMDKQCFLSNSIHKLARAKYSWAGDVERHAIRDSFSSSENLRCASS